MDAWVDLSLPLSEDIPRWPVRFEKVASPICYQMTVLHLPVHAATHLDSPLHYFAEGPSIVSFPLELTITEALVIDLTDIGANQPIGVADIVPRVPPRHPSSILLRTDWPRRAWRTPAFWAQSPWLTEDAARWLTAQKITIIGYDFPQEYAIRHIASGKATYEDFTVHLVMLAGGVWQLEYLTNLDVLPSERVSLLVCPLPLVGVEGSPVRVLARGL